MVGIGAWNGFSSSRAPLILICYGGKGAVPLQEQQLIRLGEGWASLISVAWRVPLTGA